MIKIEGLTKNYPDFRLSLSMEIPQGHVTGLVGRNGAGKSTVIKSILGLIRPDSGSVKVFGRDASTLGAAEKARMGVALSESGFSGYLSVADIRQILSRMYKSFDGAFFDRIVSAQKLPLKKPIREFSTGMKAKLRVLVAMTHGADLLILDEPTSGLDVMARNDILDMLRDYLAGDDKRSILITSHISGDLEGLCDDICMIDDGSIILREDTDVLLGSYAVLKVTTEAYEKLDKTYILKAESTPFGMVCLTDQKQYYAENCPGIIIENGSIDDVIVMLARKA